MLMGLHFFQQAQGLQISYHLAATFATLQARIFTGIFIHYGRITHYLDLGQVMAQAHFKIVGIMGRSNLHCTGTKLFIYIVIGKYRNSPIHQGEDHIPTDQMTIALILRMHRHPCVS
jgi:hypothetical protein